MKVQKILCQIVVCLASVGIALPQLGYSAESFSRATPSQVAPVRDVALNARGNLQGKVVDSSGKPLAANRVLLKQQGRVASQVATDAAGKFTVPGVRPGLYEIATDNHSGVYRVWSHQSAPPAAIDAVLLTDDEDIIRGQRRDWGHIMLVTGLVIAAGVLGGVIGYNLKDDDDAS